MSYLYMCILLILAIPKTKTKKLNRISSITIIFPETETGTISPKPTDENVIKLKYINSKNCIKKESLNDLADLKLSEFSTYKA